MSDTQITADQIIAAIERGFDAKGKDEWDAPEFEEARRLTAAAGCVWDFYGWRATLEHLKLSEWPRRLGGVTLDETCAHCDEPWEVQRDGKHLCRACAQHGQTETVRTSNATVEVPVHLAAEAREIGKAWGEAEASNWDEFHEGQDKPSWTMGSYSGALPGGYSLSDRGDGDEYARDLAYALEYIIDCAARDAWEAGITIQEEEAE